MEESQNGYSRLYILKRWNEGYQVEGKGHEVHELTSTLGHMYPVGRSALLSVCQGLGLMFLDALISNVDFRGCVALQIQPDSMYC